MSVDVGHRLFSPVGLKDEVRLLFRQVSLNNALLIDAWNAAVAPQRLREILEDPVSRAG